MSESENPSTPNPLKQRDPALAKSLAAFQPRLGNMLLDTARKQLSVQQPATEEPRMKQRSLFR